MENTIHISTLLGKATTGAGNDSGCFNLQTVSTTLPQARWKNLLECDGAADRFEQPARYHGSDRLVFFFFKAFQKLNVVLINLYSTINVFFYVLYEASVICGGALWLRQADGTVS